MSIIEGKLCRKTIKRDKNRTRNFNIGLVVIFSELQKLQMRNFDDREEQKKNERREKILYEKRSRDKQLEDEMRKKRDDRKKEKELDQILV